MECVHSGLDLFKRDGLQTSIEDGEYVEYRPLAALDEGPVEFLVKGGAEYLDPANTFIQVKAKVVLPNGDNLPAGAHVVPAANLLHSLFMDVALFLNTVQITSPSSCYPQLAYIQDLLSYDKGVKETQLEASMCYLDTAAHFQDVQGNNNRGMVARKARAAQSRVMDMVGRLHSDLFHQAKYLLSHLDLRIKLTRSKDTFVLMAVPQADGHMVPYKIELVDAALFVRKVRVSPVVALAHAKTLEKANCVYPITKTVMRVCSVSAGSFSFQEDNLFVDKLPNRLVVGFVRSEAFNGSYALNPFFFEHVDLNFLSLYHQGQQIPSKGLRPDFQGGQYTRAFMTLYQGTHTAWDNMTSGITLEDFANGYTLFCFDLTPSLAHPMEAVEVTKPGPIRIEAQFAHGLAHPMNVIVYAEFDAKLEITKTREVLLL
jgi:hypothetical protein